MTIEELLKKAYATELESCVVGILDRSGAVARIAIKPLACYHLYHHALVDPWDSQIPIHRVRCLRCKRIRYGSCEGSTDCEVLKGEWVKVAVCKCGSGRAVRGPRGYDPVFALRGPPYPLVYSGQVVACLPKGECDGELVSRGVWYWYY